MIKPFKLMTKGSSTSSERKLLYFEKKLTQGSIEGNNTVKNNDSFGQQTDKKCQAF
jgi:hypothetical protein